jgi:hypothetical protein
MKYAQTSVTVSGLLPEQDYTFNFIGLGGNWPAKIVPLSGSFVATGSSQTIDAMIHFCSNTGICPPSQPDVLPYSLNEIITETFTTSIQARVKNTCDNSTILSPSVSVIVPGYPPLGVVMPTSATLNSDVVLSTPSEHYYYFSPIISGMVPGEQYRYTINSVGGNWPVLCWPMAGLVSSSNGTSLVDLAISFCPKLDLCGGSPNLLVNYSLTNDFNLSYAPNNYFTIINMSVQQVNYPYTNIVSDQLSIRCRNCLPPPTPTPTPTITVTPSMTPTPTITPTLTRTPTPTPSSAPAFDTTINIVENGTAEGSDGITLAASRGDKLQFNANPDGGTPVTMQIYIGADQVGQITYTSSYNNQPFYFTLFSSSITYLGFFKEGITTLN